MQRGVHPSYSAQSVSVITGADGYRVAFGVAEFDPAFTDRMAILHSAFR